DGSSARGSAIGCHPRCASSSSTTSACGTICAGRYSTAEPFPDNAFMPDAVVVCVPDVPERRHMGDVPSNVDLRLVPPEPEPIPELADVDLIVPSGRSRSPLLDLLVQGGGHLRVIQTTSAGVDWLIGRVPAHVTVCNARGVYDAPLAEWV